MARTPNPWGDPVRTRRKGDVFKIVYYPTGLVGDPAARKTYPGAWKTLEEAENAAAVLRHHLKEHRARYAGGRKTELTLLSALDAYVGELERQVDSGVVPYGTMKTRRSHLNLYVHPAAEREPRPAVRDLPGDMARHLVNGIADSRKKDGSLKKENTVSKPPSSLRAFGRWLAHNRYLAEDPFAFLDEHSDQRQQEKKLAIRKRAVERAQQEVPEFDGDTDSGIGLEDVPTLAIVSALGDAIYRRERGEGRGGHGGCPPLPRDVARHASRQPEFCTATGLRMCETLAVHTSRIRLDERAIHIDRQLDQSRHWVPGQAPPLIPPKHNRDRTALVWPAFLEVLEELMAWADANTAGWLFAPTRGQKNWVRGRMDQWSRAIELLEDEHRAAVARGVPGPTLPLRWTWAPHYTRHAYGSYSLAPELSGGHGWSVAVVSSSMGHGDEQTTTGIYRHVTDGERGRVRSARIEWPSLGR